MKLIERVNTPTWTKKSNRYQTHSTLSEIYQVNSTTKHHNRNKNHSKTNKR
jgi:hypothetical protein